MRRAIFSLLGFVLFFQTVSAGASIKQITTPPDLLFGPVSDISNIPIVKKLPHLTQPSTVERGKIDFLIARVRKSKLTFVRNGEMHSGTRAAMHLAYKYRKRIENIKTVRQFVEEVASGSSLTGQPYYVKNGEAGKAYRVRDVFLNELRVLDEYLSKPAAATAA